MAHGPQGGEARRRRGSYGAFVRRTQILLGAILLDLLAVLFGGAVALLPVFARSILHVGPEGLGMLRAAPAVGALIAAAMLTRRPLLRKAGRLLLVVVGTYGASIVVFGLSRSFALSLIMLAVGGFADMFSMNIRSTTPRKPRRTGSAAECRRWRWDSSARPTSSACSSQAWPRRWSAPFLRSAAAASSRSASPLPGAASLPPLARVDRLRTSGQPRQRPQLLLAPSTSKGLDEASA